MWIAALCFAAGYLPTYLGTPPPEEEAPPRIPVATTSSPASGPAPSATIRRIDQPVRGPVYAVVALVTIAIFLAARRPGLLKGAAVGIGVALAGSTGIAMGLSARIGSVVQGERMGVLSALSALTALMLCTLSGALFGALAERRRRIADRLDASR